jgi:hypothetical protein
LDPANSSGLADVPSMFFPEPLEGSNSTGWNGGGAEEIGVAEIGSDCD